MDGRRDIARPSVCLDFFADDLHRMPFGLRAGKDRTKNNFRLAAVLAPRVNVGNAVRAPPLKRDFDFRSVLNARLRVWSTALTAVFLSTKAVLACYWASLEEDNLAFGFLLLFVVVPSGIWALVLAGTAAWLTGKLSEGLKSDTGDGFQSGPAKLP
jgi:hypothetical protein